jgi:Na+-driven multidrug efflux pump
LCAWQYSNIRALGSVAVMVNMVAQSALLGAKDSLTPLLAVLVAGCVNLLGDIALVTFGGCGGWAISSIAAGHAHHGTGLYIQELCTKSGKEP